MTYNDYLIKITETIKIRSTNYRMSQNDIVYLTNNVYDEIATEINIDFLQQLVLIDKAIDEYDVEALFVPSANEFPTDVMSIRDEDGIDVAKFFREIGRNRYKVNTLINEEMNYRFLDQNDGKNITFNRALVPDIETLSTKLQTILFPAIVNGIIYYTHDAIPNPVGDGNPMGETNAHYQRYVKSKKDLIKMLPQRI